MSEAKMDQAQTPQIAREATAKDMPLIASMIEAMQRLELGLQGFPLLEAGQVVDPYMGELKAMVDEHDGEIIVYEIDKEVVGFIAGFAETDPDLTVEKSFHDYALISDIYVRQNMRGLGVARALISEFERKMSDKGYKYLRIWSKAKNAGAIAAYLRSGFEAYETVFTKRISPKKNGQ